MSVRKIDRNEGDGEEEAAAAAARNSNLQNSTAH